MPIRARNLTAATTLTVLLLLASDRAGAATYFVTPAQGASAINALSLQAGDTVVMGNGTWTNQVITFAGAGTAANNITLKAETAGRVILNGSSRLSIGGSYMVVDGLRFQGGALTTEQQSIVQFRTGTSASTYASNSKVINSAFIDYNPSSSSFRYFWVTMYGQNNTVENNFFKGRNHSGVTIWTPHTNVTTAGHVIRNNHFVDEAYGGGANGFETLKLGDSATQTVNAAMTIERNLFERTNGETETISVKSSNNVIRGNTLREVRGTITLRHGTGNTVDGNFFYGNGTANTGGVRVIDSDHRITNNYFQDIGTISGGVISLAAGQAGALPYGYAPVNNVLIANNTLINSVGASIRYDDGYGTTPTPPSGDPAIIRDQRPANVRMLNNIMTKSTGNHYNGTEGSGWVWRKNIAHGGNGTHTGVDTATNPQLVWDAQQRLWRPTNTAGIQNQGTSTAADWGSFPVLTKDFDGQNRVGTVDIGADEINGSGGITNRPLSGSDVGPSWLSRRTMTSSVFQTTSPIYLIEAENFTASLDPNGDGDKWTVVNVSGASGGKAIKAPAGSIPSTSNHDAVVEYDIAFHEAGNYFLYMHARGINTSSDSVFTPTAFNANPATTTQLTGVNAWGWYSLGTFTVSSSQVNIPLTLSLGKREANAEIDLLVFSATALTLPPAGSFNPEPGTAALLVLGLGVVLRRR